MTTNIQAVKKKKRYKKVKNRKLALNKCPQKRGTCLKTLVISTKKPNSSGRKIAKVEFKKNKRVMYCAIPGIGHTLSVHSTVLVRACKVRDLPGVRYRIIRGKFDLSGVVNRTKARSKYGLKKKGSRGRKKERKRLGKI